MSEYVFRYAHGFGGELDECDHTDNVDHFGTLHEEIVRCRDCACWYRGYCGRHSYEVANQHGDTYTEGLFPMDEDDFCSLGELMEVRDD